jgi:hypothetical protein
MPVGEGMELVTNCLSDEKKCTSSFRGVDNPTALLFRWRFVLRKWNIAVSAVYVFPQELNLKGAYGRSKFLHRSLCVGGGFLIPNVLIRVVVITG